MPTLLQATRPQIHGHRGCRGLRPENTIPAFLHALALGVEVLELDVIISADWQVVVSHEPWPSAQYCTAPDGLAVSPALERSYNFFRLPYARIQEFDCGQRQHPSFQEQQTEPAYKPLLADVIRASDQFARQVGRPLPRYAVELKSTSDGDNIYHPEPKAFVELVLQVVHASQALPRTTLLCFDLRILQAARQAWPSLRLCFLTEEQFQIPDIFGALGFVPEVFGPDYLLLSEQNILQLLEAYSQLDLVPWTVNAPADIRRLLQYPLAGITTDYPDRALALRG